MTDVDRKLLVARGYGKVAEGLLGLRRKTPPSGRKQSYLERLTEGLPYGAWVLDLGCGAGEQAAWLSKRFRIVGVDISRSQLALARQRAPSATFLLADMCSLQFKPASFAAIAAIYSIIHIPRNEHEQLFGTLHRILKPGGRLFAVLGAGSWEGTEANWLDLGAEMFWSHHDVETGLGLLRGAGFHVVYSKVEPDELTGSGAHLFVLSEKPR